MILFVLISFFFFCSHINIAYYVNGIILVTSFIVKSCMCVEEYLYKHALRVSSIGFITPPIRTVKAAITCMCDQ